MKTFAEKTALAGLLVLAACVAGPARAQQFNSDSWLSKPHGMATIILTTGERNQMFMTTLSLLPRWEFTAAAYVYNVDDDPATDDGYSTSYYAKYMFYENTARTGGAAVKAGTGMDPGYITSYGLQDAFQTYWMNTPATLPFMNNKLQLDVMPGASYSRSRGADSDGGWAFTYSTRVAWYPRNMETSLVGEVFGAEGDVRSIPEYKAGIRWEPNLNTVVALTYGHEFDGDLGAGFEIGVMLFTPPFLKL
ncbi:MAG TPA: hypothetical protein VFX92_09435 [Candidatus Krumholzibacteria bacterium]|nr:hypothetical protein [Candidatus Krumholzibacteria bacterium]